MSFRHETSQLARELAQLAHSGASRSLDADGLAVALVARRDTLQLLRQVLANVTGNPGAVGPARAVTFIREEHSIQEAERRPVAMLARMLAATPQPIIDPAPEFADRGASSSDGARSWAEIRRHTLLAGHEWSERAPTPTGDQQWSAVADVAALARTVAVLDHDLLEAAQRHPDLDPAVADELQGATTSGLRIAATETGAVASAGPTPDWTEPGPERNPSRVLAVNNPGAVVAAQKRLVAQIQSAEHLSPQAVVLLADGQARFLDAAARALSQTDPARAEHARQLAVSIRTNITGTRQLAALMPDDPRPPAQTRALLMGVATSDGRGWQHPSSQPYISAIAAGVDTSRAVVRALSTHAAESVRNGRWLVPNIHAEAADDLLWRRARPKEWARPPSRGQEQETEPRLLRGLSSLVARADTLAQVPAVTAGGRVMAPRDVLGGANAPGQYPRPQTPGRSALETTLG